MNTRFRPHGPAVTDLTRRVGSLHLAVAGSINVGIAVVVGALALSGQVTRLLVTTLPTLVDEVVLVANTPLVLSVAAWGAPAVSAVLLLVGSIQLYNSWYAYHARRWTWGVGSAVLGAVSPFTLPAGIVAVVLLFLSKAQFADPASAQWE